MAPPLQSPSSGQGALLPLPKRSDIAKRDDLVSYDLPRKWIHDKASLQEVDDGGLAVYKVSKVSRVGANF